MNRELSLPINSVFEAHLTRVISKTTHMNNLKHLDVSKCNNRYIKLLPPSSRPAITYPSCICEVGIYDVAYTEFREPNIWRSNRPHAKTSINAKADARSKDSPSFHRLTFIYIFSYVSDASFVRMDERGGPVIVACL